MCLVDHGQERELVFERHMDSRRSIDVPGLTEMAGRMSKSSTVAPL